MDSKQHAMFRAVCAAGVFVPLLLILVSGLRTGKPKKRGRKLSRASSSDADLIEATTWFATDAAGHVAAFWNGEVPASAMEFLRRWGDVEARVLELPVIGQVHLLIRKEDYWSEGPSRGLSQQAKDAVADLMWPRVEQNASACPKRGIYQFRGEYRADGAWPRTYRVIATPLVPIHIDELPGEIRGAVSATRFAVRFADVKRIDLREL